LSTGVAATTKERRPKDDKQIKIEARARAHCENRDATDLMLFVAVPRAAVGAFRELPRHRPEARRAGRR
jgi:hypothetical protein